MKVKYLIVGPQKVFYDIGSHYGWFSLAWLSSGGAFVELFEPSIDNGKILEETIKRNKYIKKSNLHNFALGDKPHKSKLYLFPGDSSRNFVDENKQELGNNKSELFDEVQIEIIDDIYNRFSLKKPDLIKIDVEGFEYKVLLGAEQLLRDIRPIVIIEIHDVENGLLVSDFMSKIGYKLKILGYKGRNKNLPLVLWS